MSHILLKTATRESLTRENPTSSYETTALPQRQYHCMYHLYKMSYNAMKQASLLPKKQQTCRLLKQILPLQLNAYASEQKRQESFTEIRGFSIAQSNNNTLIIISRSHASETGVCWKLAD
jgi:hypothetical protein